VPRGYFYLVTSKSNPKKTYGNGSGKFITNDFSGQVRKDSEKNWDVRVYCNAKIG